MHQQIAKATDTSIIEDVLVKGDLSKLTPEERAKYYMDTCKSMGLNPLTKPFEYITLNNKLTLYATRSCTDQLRALHEVSILDLTRATTDGVHVVTAKVQNGKGRVDMSTGAVSIGNLRGDFLANALMKAETKAKRRATLSICGLGWLDESELETIPDEAKRMKVVTSEAGKNYPPPSKLSRPEPVAAAGERREGAEECPAPSPTREQVMKTVITKADIEEQLRAVESQSAKPEPQNSARSRYADEQQEQVEAGAEIARLDEALEMAASDGWESLRIAWTKVPIPYQDTLKAALERRHKPKAREIEASRMQ
jgi:hypothetical protein